MSSPQDRRKRQSTLWLTPREQQRRDRQRRKAIADKLPIQPDDHLVLKFKDWCKAAGVCERTGRRILASGFGPVVTKLTAKMIGIRLRDHRVWLAQRAEQAE